MSITVSKKLPGGDKNSLNVAAAAVVQAGESVLVRILVVNPGTVGNLVVNDAATVGAAATTNEIISIPFGNLTIGQVFFLDFPCANGIVVSAAPTGSQFSIAYS